MFLSLSLSPVERRSAPGRHGIASGRRRGRPPSRRTSGSLPSRVCRGPRRPAPCGRSAETRWKRCAPRGSTAGTPTSARDSPGCCCSGSSKAAEARPSSTASSTRSTPGGSEDRKQRGRDIGRRRRRAGLRHLGRVATVAVAGRVAVPTPCRGRGCKFICQWLASRPREWHTYRPVAGGRSAPGPGRRRQRAARHRSSASRRRRGAPPLEMGRVASPPSVDARNKGGETWNRPPSWDRTFPDAASDGAERRRRLTILGGVVGALSTILFVWGEQ